MRVKFWEPAGEYEQYMPHAFDGVIGQDVPFRDSPGGREIGRATVVSVAVDEDGRGATWTVDVTGEAGRAYARMTDARRASFAFREPDPDLMPHDPLAPKPLLIMPRDPGQEGRE